MCVSCWGITLVPVSQTYSTVQREPQKEPDKGDAEVCSESCEPDTVTDMLPLRRQKPGLPSD